LVTIPLRSSHADPDGVKDPPGGRCGIGTQS
jgi:hypothetical protein